MAKATAATFNVKNIAGNQDVHECALREMRLVAISGDSRSVRCHADRIIITAGAQTSISSRV
ncbi:hypothetical protein OK016_20090 [Vibrio chagasii]|nr:hypothetical protein [Vibrio chagasii]